MNTKQFLKNSDENILKFDVSETVDSEKNFNTAVFLTIGKNKKQERQYLESLSIEEIENPRITFHQFEIMLTKEELKFMLAQIENYV